MKAEVIKQIQKIYENDGNIMDYLRKMGQRDYNTLEDIMISYDFQAGTYNENYYRNQEKYDRYHNEIAEIMNY